MLSRQPGRRTPLAIAVVATLTAGSIIIATGPAAADQSVRQPTPTVADAKTALAAALAASLQDTVWAGQVHAALITGPVDAIALAGQSSTLGAARFLPLAQGANDTILAAKGLPSTVGSVVDIRLAGTASAHTRPAVALVAAETNDDRVESVPAYDPSGREHRLDSNTVPSELVAVVGIDEHRTLTAGLALIRHELAARGVTAEGSAPQAKATAAQGYWATRVMRVRLADDEEPWIKGDAEIYTIVSGVGVDNAPHVDIVQMPYLDEDEAEYRPGQILVDWSHFKYNAVDALMMEEDDGTNYRALAQALATVLLTVLNGTQYAPMVDALLQAMPDSWWTDDPDYVDSWYLLTRETNAQRVGARGNGSIDFEPYFVTAL